MSVSSDWFAQSRSASLMFDKNEIDVYYDTFDDGEIIVVVSHPRYPDGIHIQHSWDGRAEMWYDDRRRSGNGCMLLRKFVSLSELLIYLYPESG